MIEAAWKRKKRRDIGRAADGGLLLRRECDREGDKGAENKALLHGGPAVLIRARRPAPAPQRYYHGVFPWLARAAGAFVTIGAACEINEQGSALHPTKARQSLDQVSELTTNRLSVYLRCLNVLEGAGVRTISSQSLAEQFHLNAAQIRKDLAYFGEFGVRGVGYYVHDLKRHLRQILGPRSQTARRDRRSGQPRARARRLPWLSAGGLRDQCALRQPDAPRSASSRAEASPFTTSTT